MDTVIIFFEDTFFIEFSNIRYIFVSTKVLYGSSSFSSCNSNILI